MDNHELIISCLQKFYSSLKSLNSFGTNNNLYDDVSDLDTFFSEFRNITFILQKQLKDTWQKEIYKSLKEKYLLNDELKWFVDMRNKTTKEIPFELKKELKISLYLETGILIISDPKMIINFEESFESAINYLKNILNEKYLGVELFFSSEIIFKEKGQNIDLYPRIKYGINHMSKFLEELQRMIPCNCEECIKLNSIIEPLLNKVLTNEIKFINDYTLGKELIQGEKVEMYFPSTSEKIVNLSDVRGSLENAFYSGSNGDIHELFKKFISLHLTMFELSSGNIMPNFMIIYFDNTYRTIVFTATTKSTFFRKVQELLNLRDFDEIIAIFYCGEYYEYDPIELESLINVTYDERKNFAKHEVLSFSMLDISGKVVTIALDESEINNKEYVIQTVDNGFNEGNDLRYNLTWLDPIRMKLKK